MAAEKKTACAGKTKQGCSRCEKAAAGWSQCCSTGKKKQRVHYWTPCSSTERVFLGRVRRSGYPMNCVRAYFKLDELKTTVGREIAAGATTFITMAYIIVVNPKILESAGLPFGPSMVATILTAFLGTLLMGLYARRPFAVAPYMGENAFLAFTVVKVLGLSWQAALGAVFLSGLLFSALTVLKIRAWLVAAIPENLKIGFSVGVGLFLTFIGLNETGIVALGVPGAPVHMGKLNEPSMLLAIFGFIITGVLMVRRVKGAIFLGILAVTVLAVVFGLVDLPHRLLSMPPSISPVFGRLDIAAALKVEALPVVLVMFVMIFVDTMGTLIGVSRKAGLLDDDGNLPEIEKPMLCDSLATITGVVLGTSASGAYIESATGIEVGGRSGLTAVVTAALFLSALFFAPLFAIIPSYAFGPSLIVVGMLMLSAVQKLTFDDLTEIIPVFTIMILMSFTYNIGIGMTAGFVVYPLMKVASGRAGEVSPGLWVLWLLSLLFFVFYPYSWRAHELWPLTQSAAWHIGVLPESPEFPTVTGTLTREQVHGIKSPFSRELSYNVRSVDESILDEDRRMRRLRLLVDLTEAALMQSDLSLGESLQLMEDTRSAALSLFPDKGSVYDLIYPRRFGRILAQRFPGFSS